MLVGAVTCVGLGWYLGVMTERNGWMQALQEEPCPQSVTIMDTTDASRKTIFQKEENAILETELIVAANENVEKNKNGKVTGNVELGGSLVEAVRNRNIEMVKTLIAMGADLNVQARLKNTALILAVENIDTETFKALLTAGADVNAYGAVQKQGESDWFSTGMTALIMAAQQGSTRMTKALIIAGADINAKVQAIGHGVYDERGRIKSGYGIGETALMRAVKYGNEEIAKVLIEAGADVNTEANWEGTALKMAVERGQMAVTQALIDAGADVNARYSMSDETALMKAQNTKIAKALIEAGADVNAKSGYNDHGRTALERAVKRNDTEMAKLLIAAGAKE